MKKVALILLLSFNIIKVFSQVDKIKSNSDSNSNNSSKTEDVSSPCMASCGDACFNSIAQACFDFAITGMLELNKTYVDNKDDIPIVTSIDFMTQGAYHPANTMLILPRIRGNWGLFSTDVRFNSMIEITSKGSDFYNTFDWQMLQLNLLVTKPVILRLGTGFMYENYSKSFFNEHSLGISFFMDDYKYRIDNEFRFAKDYNTSNIPRLEGSTVFNYAILQTSKLDGYISLGVMYENYYLDVPIWSVIGGMAFNFH